MSVDIKDISVVVQGGIDAKLTAFCLKSIRRLLPTAEIVLSTWENSNVDGLDYDILILNKDPGGVICDPTWKIMNNVNRQIESSKNGLKAASRRFALKIRSDIELVGLNFISAWGIYDADRAESCRVFKNRIIINNLYCADPYHTKFLFHMSDWVQFGLREDVLKLWDIPLQSNYDMGKYWEDKERPEMDPVPTWFSRYTPEQYIWTECLRKNGISFSFEYHTDFSDENLSISELSFANNFVILDYKDFGIRFLKFDPYKWDYTKQYRHASWLLIYKKYCFPSFVIPMKYAWHNLLLSKDINEDIKRIRRHFYLFFNPIIKKSKNFFGWSRRLFLILFYGVRIPIRIATILLKKAGISCVRKFYK